MISPGETAIVTVPVTLEAAPGQWPGFARFRMADTTIDVTTDDGKVLASFGTAVGGTFEFKINDGNDSWRYAIKPADFWNAFKQLHEEHTGQKLPEVTR